MSASCIAVHAAPVALQNFNVDIAQTSVSGLSSGGFMAVQFGVAYSSIVTGVGVVAGGPYYCAQGDVGIATTRCSCTGLPFISSCEVETGSTNVPQLISITERRARDGAIDPTEKLATQKIWMFSGIADSVVPTPVMDDLYAYYRHYIDEANIRYQNDIEAEHAMPTDGLGNACTYLGKPFINNCGFDAAGEMLKWIYGSLRPKNSNGLSGRFIEFDQTEFVSDYRPESIGLADQGYAYVPARCDKNIHQRCRLHVAFHGCQQNLDSIDDKFVRHAGYNQWADTNNIIVLYPQTTSTFGRNPKACWNWFDFNRNDPDYAARNGRQMRVIKAMIDRIAGVSLPPDPSPRCYTATNAEHVQAGRARNWFFFALANGSDRFLGLVNNYTVTTLKQTGPNHFVVGACP
ncbi:MAG TPA: PHB depolymerase family esterase [Noviherbaspirillum sp.]